VGWWQIPAGVGLLAAGTAILSRTLRARGGRLRLPARAGWAPAALGGLLASVLLGSSSLTVVGLAVAADAGSLPLSTAWAAVGGANVGATLLPHIAGWHPPPTALAATCAAAVVAWCCRRWRPLATGVLAALGVAVGLDLLAAGIGGLAAGPTLAGAAGRSVPLAFGAGVAATAALFSSQLALGVVQALAAAGAVPLRAGIAFICGANIGTTADVLVAALATGRRGRATALFHLGFNVVCACVGLALLTPLTLLVARWPPAAALARAHTLLNLATAVVLCPLAGAVGARTAGRGRAAP
jgi:phosphate:Na+ symporter